MPVPALTPVLTDHLLVKLAREIAIDHLDTETILKQYQISPETWSLLQENTRFQELLQSETEAWQGATNTFERTKLKAAALIEQWLPAANTILHDPQALLSSKVELGKLLTGIAGMGRNVAVEGSSADKFSITINLGADAKLKFEKQASPVIDLEPNA